MNIIKIGDSVTVSGNIYCFGHNQNSIGIFKVVKFTKTGRVRLSILSPCGKYTDSRVVLLSRLSKIY